MLRRTWVCMIFTGLSISRAFLPPISYGAWKFKSPVKIVHIQFILINFSSSMLVSLNN